jgi:hypothetical protein
VGFPLLLCVLWARETRSTYTSVGPLQSARTPPPPNHRLQQCQYTHTHNPATHPPSVSVVRSVRSIPGPGRKAESGTAASRNARRASAERRDCAVCSSTTGSPGVAKSSLCVERGGGERGERG